MKKRVLSLVLALAVCLGLAAPALAADGDFTVENGVLTKYNGPGGDVTIPDGVTSIGTGAFSWCESLTRVVLPDGVTAIGEDAFEHCRRLTGVTIPGSVTRIGAGAFYTCIDLADVYYGGSESQWNAGDISKLGNSHLTDAAIHYNSSAPAVPAGFSDVKEGDYFAQPVAWAVEKGITSGTSETTFSPDQTCTVAHILTFLWRANGSPEPAGTAKLPDADTGAYYYKPAAWAVEQGVTEGVSPDDPCTRSMVVTYLWKLAGSPAAETSKFTDVPAGADCAQAVAWAVEQEITSGTSETTFSPDQTCTRGQIVTFLYSAFAK